MWVVKIGGSLARDPVLAQWLQLLAEPHGEPIVIVPGGGAFADCVREHQALWQFGDAAAHAMAILAMAQFGLMLHALRPGIRVETDIVRLRGNDATVIWLPMRLVDEPAAIEASWDVTSDSIAAWLARRLEAKRLLLVKSCVVPHEWTAESLSAAGIVDRRFQAFVRDARFAIDLVGKRDIERVRALRNI